jgi:S1-C subfamily serine protease
MRKLAYIFFIALFLFGCGSRVIKISYQPLDHPPPNSPLKGVKIYLAPIKDIRPSKNLRIGLAGSAIDYYPAKPSANLFRKALAVKLRNYGITITEHITDPSHGTLKGILNVFEFTFGLNTIQATASIDLELTSSKGKNILWNQNLSENIEGPYGTRKEGWGFLNFRMSEVLTKTINSLDSFPEFIQTASSLSIPSPPKPFVQQPSVKQQVVSGGTGFLFSSRNYIITNWHVVKGAGSIEVKFPNGEAIKAKVLAKDSQNDIAVLKLSQSPSTQISDLNFGDSSKVRPGDRVFTIGYPASSILGKNQKITDGIVSSVTGVEDDPTMFQITVPIQPGNSGGPLFNESGEVIGITTASLSLNVIRSLGAIPQNVNYAIKSSFVNNLLTTTPKTLLSNRGIVVVPNKSGNSLADFFERVSNNIVLIEAR